MSEQYSIGSIGITERGDAALNISWFKFLHEKKPVIAITKDVKKLKLELNKEFGSYSELPLIVHATITGWGSSILEPNVPAPEIEITAFMQLNLPKMAKILRIDPIIPSKQGIQKFKDVIDTVIRIYHDNKKDVDFREIRISFLDAYNHVRDKFNKAGLDLIYWDKDKDAPIQDRLDGLQKLNNIKNNYPELVQIPITVCGEPGLSCNGCVSNNDLIYFSNKLNATYTQSLINPPRRPGCHCLSLKTELLNEKKPCAHKCLYCYWQDTLYSSLTLNKDIL